MLSRTFARQAWRIATRSTSKITTTTISSTRSPLLHKYTFRLASTTTSTPMAAPTDTAAEQTQSTTGITPDTLTSTLKSDPTLSPIHVDIQDISGGCGASFAALIVSDAFSGKSALQRNRMVNGILKKEISAVHAWTPRCVTGEQWEKMKGQGS